MSDAAALNASPPARVVEVRVGRIAPLGPDGVPSGYIKYPITDPVHAGTLGLVGDAQGDLAVHGGPEKAVYGYPCRRYAEWAAAFPAIADRFVVGAMGENLALDGADETEVHIGDRIRVGGALLQVSQPRQPCFKLVLALGEPRLARAMVRHGWCGWYYRVVVPGMIGPGDTHRIVERPNPGWSMARFAGVIAAQALGPDVLAELVALEGLATAWKVRALRQLADRRPAVP